MEDFQARLLAPFNIALTRAFGSIDIKTQVHTGHVVHENCLAFARAFKPKYPDRKYLEVFIHFPEKYVQEHEDWDHLAGILCVSILCTLGFEALAADANLHKEERRFIFWLPMNERVYQNLPPIPTPISQQELHIEGEVDKDEERRLLDLARRKMDVARD